MFALVALWTMLSPTIGSLSQATPAWRVEATSEGVQVRSAEGQWLATFTRGSRSVLLRGPQRTFTEDTASHSVTHDRWVRVLGEPFSEEMDAEWLDRALQDRSPDVLGIAFQYVKGSPLIHEGKLRIAGDASYGPKLSGKAVEEGSDYNDYLGVSVRYGVKRDLPEKRQFGSLDCSGFIRMVFGFRLGVPLGLASDGRKIPRRASQMYEDGPGVRLGSDRGKLQPGDLVFFDADKSDGTAIDHVGIFLGIDTAGRPRFISSRKSADGPTMGDRKGASVLNGRGLYGASYRGARRL
ncbi:MAG TPA: NlpC/P60 family protein [Fimbriimonas sp.]